MQSPPPGSEYAYVLITADGYSCTVRYDFSDSSITINETGLEGTASIRDKVVENKTIINGRGIEIDTVANFKLKMTDDFSGYTISERSWLLLFA